MSTDVVIPRSIDRAPGGGWAVYVADVAYLVGDLLFVSKIGEAADHLGVAVQGARDADRLAELAREARLVLVDLGHPAAMAALERLASDPATAAVESVGFVGHGGLDGMETGKALGCRRGLAQGQRAAEGPPLRAQGRERRA